MALDSPSFQTKITIQDLQPCNNKEAYKKEPKCYNCGEKFGTIGIIHAKKHMCRFCFHGFCAKCSEQSIIHPISKTQDRICDQCMEMIIIRHKQIQPTAKIRDSLRASMSMSISNPEIGRLQSDLYQIVEAKTKLIKEKDNLENQQSQLQEEIEQMELHKNRLLSQRDELKASISEKRDEIESMQQKISDLDYNWQQDINEKIVQYQEKNQRLEEEIQNLRQNTQLLEHLHEKFEKLKDDREQLIKATSDQKSGACCSIF